MADSALVAKYQREYYNNVYREKRLAQKRAAYRSTKEYKARKEAREKRQEFAKLHPTRKSITRLYSFYRSVAKRRELSWEISFEDFKFLRQLYCYYCEGDLPKCGVALDRMDNNKGYSIDNVLPCCGDCNKTRGDRYTVEETKIMIDSLKLHRKQVAYGC